ncbi:hypothetical protein ABKN59_000411 [Abortiporus biennis]
MQEINLNVLDTELDRLLQEEVRTRQELEHIKSQRTILEAAKAIIEAGRSLAADPSSTSRAEGVSNHRSGLIVAQASSILSVEDGRSETLPIPAMSNIPSEILLEIFSFCLGSTVPTDRTRLALTISHVCQRWRNLVLDTSSFWSTLSLHKPINTILRMFSRAKTQPLTLILRSRSDNNNSSYNADVVFNLIKSVTPRWQNVDVESSHPADLKSMLLILNDKTLPMPSLTTLRLCRKDPFVPGFPLATHTPPVAFPDKLPQLSCIDLHAIGLWELPPCSYPKLTSLLIGRLAADGKGQRPYVFTMSSLISFLFRAPLLIRLQLENAIPISDIRLATVKDEFTGPPSYPGARTSRPIVPPLRMKNMEEFSWSCPPAKEFWQFFYYIPMPNLRKLCLVLNQSNVAWRGLDPIPNGDPFPVVHLPKLEELEVECLDSDGLVCPFRKFSFPGIKSISLAYIPPSSREVIPLHGPDSLFRDPRLVMLTTLKLAYFQLKPDETVSFMKCVPSLETLVIDSCLGVNELLTRLSGVNNSFSASSQGYSEPQMTCWYCPHLLELTLIQCTDAKFSALRSMVQARKLSPFIGPPTPTRAIKPLKRRAARNIGLGQSASPRRSSVTPYKPVTAVQSLPTIVQPPYITPKPLRKVHAFGCARVSEVELLSLQDEIYGVEDVVWGVE